jgi:predicted acyltransferase
MLAAVKRFTALDVLRGMTVCFMIIVNSPGNWGTTWAPLLHASWNGFTPTDLVFPTFLFVVGNALSFVKDKWQGLATSALFTKIFKRTLLIFLLGYLMYWFPFFHWTDTGALAFNAIAETRILGVLQRIALAYFFAAIIIQFVTTEKLKILFFLFPLLYWGILLVGGDPIDPYNMITNAGTRLDWFLFGPDHLYHGEGVAFDPEGLLSTLPAISNVIGGYLAGKWIKENQNKWETIAKLSMAGAVLIFLALGWNNYFPINKKLWTGSFVLLTVGIDCILIAILIYIIDMQQKKNWTYFFEVLGKNPLTVYLISELGLTLLWFFKSGNGEPLYSTTYKTVFQPTGDYLGSFLFAFSWMLFCWMIGYVMDKRKIYWRV